jgi:hypothetical protein
MRVELEKLNGQTLKFIATLQKRAEHKIIIDGKELKPICIENVCNYKDNSYLTDHAWIKTNKLKGISKGSTFSFVATIESYLKKVNGQVVKDYCLTNIKYVKIL